jgi:hypothetical protein
LLLSIHIQFKEEKTMTYRILFGLNAIVAFLFGVAILVVSSMVIKQFGVDDYASTRLVAQFFGTAMLALGLVLWFAKDVTQEAVQRGIGIALLIGAAAGLIVTVLGTVAGTLRSLTWVAMLIYGLFALGYGYLVFLRPRPQE